MRIDILLLFLTVFLMNKRIVMLSRIRIFLIIAILFYSNAAEAGIKDSIKTTNDSLAKFYFFPENFEHLKKSDYKPVDTMLKGFQKYDPAAKIFPFRSSLGNIGLATRNMVFVADEKTDFNLGNHSFDAYLFSSENFRYYKGLTPFSDLFYLMGAKKEQYFNAIHSRNLSKNLTIGINYRLIRSLGYYKWHESSNTNAALSAYYTTSNKKYGFITNYIFNRVLAFENGGIYPDSLYLFEENIQPERMLITINMVADQQRKNNLKEHAFYFKQYYNLGLNKTIQLNDTTEESSYNSLGIVGHIFKFDRKAMFYEDNKANSGYYNNNYFDSTNTFDSLFFRILENKVFLSNESNECFNNKSLLYYEIGFTHQWINVSQSMYNTFTKIPGSSHKLDTTMSRLLDTLFSQYILNASVKSDPDKLISAGLSFSKIFEGYQHQDFGIAAHTVLNFSKTDSLQHFVVCKAGYTEKESPWIMKRFYSNHFFWNNRFDKVRTYYGGINYTYKSLSSGIHYAVIGNYIYFDTLAIPKQYESAVNILVFDVNKDFKFGKWSFDNTIIYQNVLKGDTIMRFPEFIFSHSFYYNGNFFKKALLTQFGLDIMYNSSYFADAYMPGSREFYLQNKTKTGDYPYIDIFANFKIKRVRFFLKYQHLTMGLFGYSYFTTPYYPLQDRALKFGLAWIFHN